MGKVHRRIFSAHIAQALRCGGSVVGAGPAISRNFTDKSKWAQVAVLVAGVTFNVIFAWLLISGGYMVGLPSSVSDDLSVRYPQNLTGVHLTVTSVLPSSPAEQAGLKVGDSIVGVSSDESVSAGSLQGAQTDA